MDLQVALLVAGGMLELGGVALAAWDVLEAFRQWRKYERRDQVVEPAPVSSHLKVLPPTVVVDPAPPVEERIAALERQVATLQRDMADAATQQRREREDRVATTQAAITRLLRHEDEALARLVRDVIVGGRRRAVGVVLFVAGIVATTLGGLPIWT